MKNSKKRGTARSFLRRVKRNSLDREQVITQSSKIIVRYIKQGGVIVKNYCNVAQELELLLRHIAGEAHKQFCLAPPPDDLVCYTGRQ